MTILRRVNKLEELVKPLVDKIEKKKEELKKRQESFELTNQIMQDFFPEHKWNQLDEKAKLQLENSEEILILTIEYFRWIEKNYDMPSDQMEALWEQHKPKALERVKSSMKI